MIEKWIGKRVKLMEMSPTRNSWRNPGMSLWERKEQVRPQRHIRESSREPDDRDSKT